MTEDWTKWESLVVNGAYPLRRFLARSDHSVVFLTEYTRNTAGDAAIKLIPADPASSEAQLAYWNAVVALSHPRLIRLFDAGRCQLGGHPFLFVVMEYAQQTLAQILPRRALTLDEVQELLPPTLDALAFLHGRNLVHRRLKPPNLLVINDQLKLASDGVRPGDAKDSKASPAGDIWALGATIVEALTQHPPDARGQAPLPDTLPSAFANTVRRCLSINPADRPTVAELNAQFDRALPMPAVAKSAPAAVPAVLTVPAVPAVPAAAPLTLPRKRFIVPGSVAVAVTAAVLVLLVLAWAGSHLLRGQQKAPQPATNSAPSLTPSAATAAAPAAAASSAAIDTPAPVNPAPDAVVHQEIPAVSARARASIRGTIKVTVRVTVDRSGRVIAQAVENRVSSKYFARVAGEAARKWRFAPGSEESRQWLLQFEFTRGATAAHATRHIL
jgi:TonB family protein